MTPDRSLASAALLAVVSAAVFVIALGLAGVAGEAARAAGADMWLIRAAPAAVTLVVTVPLILLLHRRTLRVLALGRPHQAAVGFVVVLVAGGAVFGVDGALGGTRIIAVDSGVLGVFLVTNTLSALALEALPEELTFRGAAFGVLKQRLPVLIAVTGATVLFVLAPAASISVTWAIGSLLTLPVPPPTFAPGGQDPVVYGLLLTVFAVMLSLARLGTGSVWTCVGAHLAFLTVNRTLVPSSGFETGVSVVAPPGAELLVVVYLVLVLAAFALMTRRRRRAS